MHFHKPHIGDVTIKWLGVDQNGGFNQAKICEDLTFHESWNWVCLVCPDKPGMGVQFMAIDNMGYTLDSIYGQSHSH